MAHLETICPQCGKPLDPGGSDNSSCPQCGRSNSDPTVLADQRDAKVRRPARTVLVATLAIATIGTACAVVYPIVRDEVERGRMQLARSAAPAANNWWRVIALSTLRERYAQDADRKTDSGAIKS
jgi:hypothetical protein